MSRDSITIYGERPKEIPNPSASSAFRARYPTLFVPLQSQAFEDIRTERSLALVAPTSSGKTLAVAAPLFEFRRKAVFVYPFRALVLDQTNQLIRYGALFGLSEQHFAQVIGGTPQQALAAAVEKPYILMTPDKLVSLLLGGRTPKGAALTILSNYAFVFDEIHAYNALMRASLRHFIRSVRFWRQGVGGGEPSFYFLSATFPDELWVLLQKELSMSDANRIEGTSMTGDVTLVLRPSKDHAEMIAQEMADFGMTTNVVGIFNTAGKAWRVAERLWGRELARRRLFVGQDKMSEHERVDNFKAFIEQPETGGLCGSPAIEAGVDFPAANLVMEETYADSFLQRFGRAARSGQHAYVLCYSSTLYSARQAGLLRDVYDRRSFLDMVRERLPLREPQELLTGLAAYPYYRFWQEPDFLEPDTLALCRKLDEKEVEPLLAFRGFVPYTQYESGERISFRALFQRDLPMTGEKVVGAPSLERYFFARLRPPVNARIKQLGYSEKVDKDTTVLLAKVSFEGFGTHWVVLEIKSAEYERNHPHEHDDNICLRGLPCGEVGRVSQTGIRNGIVRFYEVDA